MGQAYVEVHVAKPCEPVNLADRRRRVVSILAHRNHVCGGQFVLPIPSRCLSLGTNPEPNQVTWRSVSLFERKVFP